MSNDFGMIFILADILQRGLAPSIWVAIVGRFVAGLGAAGITDLVSIIVNGKSPFAR